MNLINSLYTPSYLLPLIIMLATIIILMIATHMARYGDTTIPLLIGILLLFVNVGAIIYTNYKTDDLLKSLKKMMTNIWLNMRVN